MTTERKNYDDIEVNSFEDLNLKENLLRGIYGYGYEKPMLFSRRQSCL